MSDWNSEQYLKFKKERTQPSIDLCKRIDNENPKRIIDIGCGPGNSTSVLYERFGKSYILGADNSEDMLSKARKEYPYLDFKKFDASSEQDYKNIGKFDIVFSNACIQWVPDHRVLLKRFMSLLNDGGELAVQVPMNYDEPIHKIIKSVSESDKWKNKFGTSRTFYTLTQSEYFDILSDLSPEFQMWKTVYFHRMSSHNDIIEWYKGTGLRPYLDALDGEDKTEFQNEIYERLVKEYPKQKNGEIVFYFPRLFFIVKNIVD